MIRRLLPLLALVLLFPLFVALGYWQLERAAEKQRLQAEYDSRAHDTPVRIGARRAPADDLRFRRVVARGVYEPAHQVLIDNRVHRGRAGYHVITPLRLEGSALRVLVNRGWVPQGPSRAELPPTDTPEGVVEVSGVATVPAEKVFMLAEPGPLGARWETVWQHLDLERYAQAVPFELQPVVVLLDPQAAAGGFVREWSRLDAGIAVHQGYAFQWFALAAALLVIYFLLSRRAAARNGAGGAGGDGR